MRLDHLDQGSRAAAGWLGLIGLLLLSGSTLCGQELNGVIYGKVTDAQGHPQQVMVHLLAEGDQPAGDMFTDAEGQYAFRELPAGQYWVVVEADGFRPSRQPVRLEALINPKMQANLTLEPTSNDPAPPSPIIAGSTSSHTVDARKPGPYFDPRAVREFEKGNASRKKGDLKGAITHYEKALRIDPLLYPALNNLGVAYDRQGARPQAEKVLLRAIEINSGDGESYVNLGHVLYDEGRYTEARVRLEEGLKRSPGSATGHFFLGSTELKLGDLGQAESNLKQACLLDPKGIPAAHLQLANVYLRARQMAAAGTELEDYLRANPDDPQAPAIRRLLASVKASLKN